MFKPLNPNATRARRVLYACRVLERAGCKILRATSQNCARITVDRPPRLDWIRPAHKISGPAHDTMAARVGDIQVEWTDRLDRRYL